jgi:hypothetical protein
MQKEFEIPVNVAKQESSYRVMEEDAFVDEKSMAEPGLQQHCGLMVMMLMTLLFESKLC